MRYGLYSTKKQENKANKQANTHTHAYKMKILFCADFHIKIMNVIYRKQSLERD